MVVLAFYQEAHKQALGYQLDEAQSRFTHTPSEWLKGADADEPCADVHKIVILQDDVPVGFFVLDGGAEKLNYTDDAQAMLLRSMSVNPAYQGQGLAKQALQRLPDFCQAHFSDASAVVLGVNHENSIAQAVYEKAGFVKMPKVFMGQAGAQYSYHLPLKPVAL